MRKGSDMTILTPGAPQHPPIEVTPRMPKTVAARVVAVARKVEKLVKESRNEFANYNYVSIDAFYEGLGPLMSEAGIFTILDEVGTVVDKGVLTCNYQIFIVSEEGEMYGPIHREVTVKASGPQAYASAASFAEKYFLRAIFKVPTGEKIDADMQDKTTLPDSKTAKANPQVEVLSPELSSRLADELIAGLHSCQSALDLKDWEKQNSGERARKLVASDYDRVNAEYSVVKETIAKSSKEKVNG